MASIADKIAQIRQAIFGKDVRENIASGIEAINSEVENTTQRQSALEDNMNNLADDLNESESLRVTSENTRVSNEQSRSAAESNRVTEFNNIKSTYEAATKENVSVELTAGRHDNVNNIDYDNIGARLDAHSSSLNDIPNQSYITEKAKTVDVNNSVNSLQTQITNMGSGSPKGTYATLTALQTAFPTGTTGTYVVTADGGWYYWNGSAWTKGGTYQATGIAIKSIALEQTKFLQTGENIYNKDTAIIGYAQDTSGNSSANASYDISDFIPVEANTSYTIDKGLRICNFYDCNKNFVSNIYNNTTADTPATFTTPSQDGYVRMTLYTAKTAIATLIKGTTAKSGLNYENRNKYFVANKIDYDTVDFVNIKDLAVGHKHASFLSVGKNLLNPATMSIGYYIDHLTGIQIANVSYNATDYIKVKSGVTYAISACRRVSIFDINKVNIPSAEIDNSTQTPVTITPTQDGFLRVTFATANTSTAQIEVGNTQTSYEAYNVKLTYLTYENKSVKMQHLEQSIQDSLNGLNPLLGKKVVNFGDSTAAGDGNSGVGYAELIAQYNGMTCYDHALGGSTIRVVDGATNNILNEINNATETDVDYVLFDGLGNDVSPIYADNSLIGAISSGYTATLDTSKFCGAFETTLKTLINKYMGKKILYICMHRMSSRDLNIQEQLYTLARQMCNKWAVPYVDLFNEGGLNTYIDTMKTTYTNNADGTHPNQLGYDTYYVPRISAKMKMI